MRNQEGALYKLDFTWFSGSSAGGKVNFLKELMSPAAPTDAIISDFENSFGWTPLGDYPNADDYEYVTADTILTCSTNPQVLEGEFEIGAVSIRLKADETSCRPYGLSLANDVAFTGIISPKASGADFALYPNPAKENVNVKLDFNSNDLIKVEVFNLLGALIFEDLVSSSVGVYSISTENFANGMYNIKIQSGSISGSKMFVVNN